MRSHACRTIMIFFFAGFLHYRANKRIRPLLKRANGHALGLEINDVSKL